MELKKRWHPWLCVCVYIMKGRRQWSTNEGRKRGREEMERLNGALGKDGGNNCLNIFIFIFIIAIKSVKSYACKGV